MTTGITRKPTRRIFLGTVPVGGNAPIAVQSMTNTPTADVAATVEQILRLEAAGCEIIRVAVPDEDAADAITQIKPQIHIPLVADIHFGFRLAVAAAKNGADGLRINPGNIGVNITRCETIVGDDRVAKMRFQFEMSNPAQLTSVLNTIKRIDAVYDVHRILPGAATRARSVESPSMAS